MKRMSPYIMTSLWCSTCGSLMPARYSSWRACRIFSPFGKPRNKLFSTNMPIKENCQKASIEARWRALSVRGHPFMTSTKNSGFWIPLLPVHMRPHKSDPLPLWKSTWGRHEIHIALLKRLVQWSSGPKAKIRLYGCNLFKTVLWVIYTTNLYHRKFSTFYSVERRNSGLKRHQLLCMRRRQDEVSGLYF